MEDLRQSCLHTQLLKTGETHLWFDYIHAVHAACFDFISIECSENAHKKLGLDWTNTKKCVNSSFLGYDKAKEDNTIMKANAD